MDKVKGAVVRPMVEWFGGMCGEGELVALGESLRPATRAEIFVDAPSLGILPAGWYSEALASELADGIVKRATATMHDVVVLRQIGRTIVDRSLGRISRAAVEWFASPQTIARSAPMFWRLYHDTGEVDAHVEGDSMHARCTHWCGHGQTWCRVVGASACRVLELAGLRDARVWVHKCTGGNGDCSLTFRWAHHA